MDRKPLLMSFFIPYKKHNSNNLLGSYENLNCLLPAVLPKNSNLEIGQYVLDQFINFVQLWDKFKLK